MARHTDDMLNSQEIFLEVTNDGKGYDNHILVARLALHRDNTHGAQSTVAQFWVNRAGLAAQRLWTQGERMEKPPSAFAIISAALQLQEYYESHVLEVDELI